VNNRQQSVLGLLSLHSLGRITARHCIRQYSGSFHYCLLGAGTTRPGELHAGLCHAFLVRLFVKFLSTLCLKNDTDVAHYNFNSHQPILVIFGRGVAKTVCYQMVICYLTSPNECLCTTWGNAEMQQLHLFFRMQQY